MKVKGWTKFQHFKDRKPPWIKLYREILDDVEWHELDGETAKNLVMIWLIASENNDGTLPPIKTVAFRLRKTEKELNAILSNLCHWLYDDDIKPISSRYQNDSVEEEIERETEEETEEEGKRENQTLSLAILRKPRTPKKIELSDAEWLESLKASPAYNGLEVEVIYSKMLSWCDVNSKIPSRKRFVNWLNREERPMTAGGKGKQVKPRVGMPARMQYMAELGQALRGQRGIADDQQGRNKADTFEISGPLP